jgi:hypothetical protein
MDATEDLVPLLDAVANDPALAVGANRCECMDRALEAIERVPLPGDG